MDTDWSNRYSEISEAPDGARCDYCGGASNSENVLLMFSALSRPAVSVHRRCYIHWAFQQSESSADADETN